MMYDPELATVNTDTKGKRVEANQVLKLRKRD